MRSRSSPHAPGERAARHLGRPRLRLPVRADRAARAVQLQREQVGLPFTGWTLDWYSQVFGDYQIKDALTTSIKVALEVS